MNDHYAIRYAAAGMKVLPLHWPLDGACSCGKNCGGNGAKHPLLRHGLDEASSEVEQVGEWLARWPHANWGLVPPSGVVVLDVDPRNGGHNTLTELEQTHGPLPATLTCITGSGGQHYWFQYAGPLKGKLGPGLDLKSHRGYLVSPPSRHLAGGRYEWADPDEVAVPAPVWFRTLLTPPVPRRPVVARPVRPDQAIDRLIAFVSASLEGERNRRLFWACCRAVEQRVDPAPLIEAAVEIGYPRTDAERTALSAMRTYARKEARHQ